MTDLLAASHPQAELLSSWEPEFQFYAEEGEQFVLLGSVGATLQYNWTETGLQFLGISRDQMLARVARVQPSRQHTLGGNGARVVSWNLCRKRFSKKYVRGFLSVLPRQSVCLLQETRSWRAGLYSGFQILSTHPEGDCVVIASACWTTALHSVGGGPYWQAVLHDPGLLSLC